MGGWYDPISPTQPEASMSLDSEGTRMADAATIIAGWKRRLLAMAQHPAYVLRDTPADVIARHNKRITSFVGFSESDIAAAEGRLGVTFPLVFRQYLLEMGQSPGELFRGSELAGPATFAQFRADAMEMLAEDDPSLTLPREAVVFLSHQGYSFLYLLARSGFDSPAMQWGETQPKPVEVAAGFAALVDAELDLMERNHQTMHRQGGYYRTMDAANGGSMVFPALNSGDRPLQQAQRNRPWWRFW